MAEYGANIRRHLRVIESILPDEEGHFLPKEFDMMKKYSREEAFRENLEKLKKDIRLQLHANKRLELKSRKTDTEEIQGKLSKISSDLLSSSLSETENIAVRRLINELEHSYKTVMEKFLLEMEKFWNSCRELKEDLYKTAQKFHDISRLTAGVTLLASGLEVFFITGSVLHDVFNISWAPKLPFVTTFVGSISITTALVALSYMRQSTAEITKDVRDENRLLTDLMISLRRGNWVDEEVLKIFPHGIDLKLLDEAESKSKTTNGNKLSWRHHLCSVIILTNIQKDDSLLEDEAFLTKVKMFVRSQAAEIWWCRRKIKKLMEAFVEKVEAISIKEFIADHEIHFQRTALYLYPIMIPLFLNALNTGKKRFFSSIFALILASCDLAHDESEETKELNNLLKGIGKDFKKIAEVCHSLDNDYD